MSCRASVNDSDVLCSTIPSSSFLVCSVAHTCFYPLVENKLALHMTMDDKLALRMTMEVKILLEWLRKHSEDPRCSVLLRQITVVRCPRHATIQKCTHWQRRNDSDVLCSTIPSSRLLVCSVAHTCFLSTGREQAGASHDDGRQLPTISTGREQTGAPLLT